MSVVSSSMPLSPESSQVLKSARLFVLEPWIMESIMLPMTLTE